MDASMRDPSPPPIGGATLAYRPELRVPRLEVAMLGTALHLLFAPAIWIWLAFSSRSWRRLLTPGPRPRSTSSGPNADRVLLVGAGIAVGYGVTSADLALGGYLARALSALTGRGANVNTVARFGLRVRDSASVLRGYDLGRYDALVMVVGADEALMLETPERFASDVRAFMLWVAMNGPAGFPVLFVGIPDVTSIMAIPGAVHSFVRARCDRLDAELKRLCTEHPSATYVPFTPDPADLERNGGRHVYAAWASVIAPTVGRVLDGQAADPRDPEFVEELRRQLALDDLRILDTEPEARFDRIVMEVRRTFGVRGASITFIDRNRQWSKASLGVDPVDSPRGSALGDATVHNGKLLVVEDASLHEAYRSHPWVTGPSGIRFFAGFPIEARNGERIGALCISDPVPRQFSASDDALLGSFARSVERELSDVAAH